MTGHAIRVIGVGKRYLLNRQNRSGYGTLRESISSLIQRKHNPAAQDDFWAVRDLSFDIQKGEVVGVLGRNGAGKSTLLKVLSRITPPTEGRIEFCGRISSLLEVGTGFHPELSGRENIYLNGAILGMPRTEIDRKFDEIVAFAEVERFLDTPVKRYSSGMYMRLAFAVAAHLEPDILLVDEVLAVGDATFQKKCLGKMHDVATREGRTVVFVSHNMQAVRALCTKALWIDRGQLIAHGDVTHTVTQYLTVGSAPASEKTWTRAEAPGDASLRLLSVRVNSDIMTHTLPTSLPIYVDVQFETFSALRGLCVGFDIITGDGVTVLRSYHTDLPEPQWPVVEAGVNHFRCTIRPGLLNGGTYYVCPKIGIHNVNWIVNLDGAVRFEMALDHGVSPLWNSLNGVRRPGLVAPVFEWENVGAAVCR
jgi:lipopolysaccharide transport system ATP-binding protein